MDRMLLVILFVVARTVILCSGQGNVTPMPSPTPDPIEEFFGFNVDNKVAHWSDNLLFGTTPPSVTGGNQNNEFADSLPFGLDFLNGHFFGQRSGQKADKTSGSAPQSPKTNTNNGFDIPPVPSIDILSVPDNAIDAFLPIDSSSRRLPPPSNEPILMPDRDNVAIPSVDQLGINSNGLFADNSPADIPSKGAIPNNVMTIPGFNELKSPSSGKNVENKKQTTELKQKTGTMFQKGNADKKDSKHTEQSAQSLSTPTTRSKEQKKEDQDIWNSLIPPLPKDRKPIETFHNNELNDKPRKPKSKAREQSTPKETPKPKKKETRRLQTTQKPKTTTLLPLLPSVFKQPPKKTNSQINTSRKHNTMKSWRNNKINSLEKQPNSNKIDVKSQNSFLSSKSGKVSESKLFEGLPGIEELGAAIESNLVPSGGRVVFETPISTTETSTTSTEKPSVQPRMKNSFLFKDENKSPASKPTPQTVVLPEKSIKPPQTTPGSIEDLIKTLIDEIPGFGPLVGLDSKTPQPPTEMSAKQNESISNIPHIPSIDELFQDSSSPINSTNKAVDELTFKATTTLPPPIVIPTDIFQTVPPIVQTNTFGPFENIENIPTNEIQNNDKNLGNDINSYNDIQSDAIKPTDIPSIESIFGINEAAPNQQRNLTNDIPNVQTENENIHEQSIINTTDNIKPFSTPDYDNTKYLLADIFTTTTPANYIEAPLKTTPPAITVQTSTPDYMFERSSVLDNNIIVLPTLGLPTDSSVPNGLNTDIVSDTGYIPFSNGTGHLAPRVGNNVGGNVNLPSQADLDFNVVFGGSNNADVKENNLKDLSLDPDTLFTKSPRVSSTETRTLFNMQYTTPNSLSLIKTPSTTTSFNLVAALPSIDAVFGKETEEEVVIKDSPRSPRDPMKIIIDSGPKHEKLPGNSVPISLSLQKNPVSGNLITRGAHPTSPAFRHFSISNQPKSGGMFNFPTTNAPSQQGIGEPSVDPNIGLPVKPLTNKQTTTKKPNGDRKSKFWIIDIENSVKSRNEKQQNSNTQIISRTPQPINVSLQPIGTTAKPFGSLLIDIKDVQRSTNGQKPTAEKSAIARTNEQSRNPGIQTQTAIRKPLPGRVVAAWVQSAIKAIRRRLKELRARRNRNNKTGSRSNTNQNNQPIRLPLVLQLNKRPNVGLQNSNRPSLFEEPIPTRASIQQVTQANRRFHQSNTSIRRVPQQPTTIQPTIPIQPDLTRARLPTLRNPTTIAPFQQVRIGNLQRNLPFFPRQQNNRNAQRNRIQQQLLRLNNAIGRRLLRNFRLRNTRTRNSNQQPIWRTQSSRNNFAVLNANNVLERIRQARERTLLASQQRNQNQLDLSGSPTQAIQQNRRTRNQSLPQTARQPQNNPFDNSRSNPVSQRINFNLPFEQTIRQFIRNNNNNNVINNRNPNNNQRQQINLSQPLTTLAIRALRNFNLLRRRGIQNTNNQNNVVLNRRVIPISTALQEINRLRARNRDISNFRQNSQNNVPLSIEEQFRNNFRNFQTVSNFPRVLQNRNRLIVPIQSPLRGQRVGQRNGLGSPPIQNLRAPLEEGANGWSWLGQERDFLRTTRPL